MMHRYAQAAWPARMPATTEEGPPKSADVLSLIGNTPLLELNTASLGAGDARIFAKAEWFNPGGSIKDRAAASIIADAERTGRLHRGIGLLDSTSGNTGIAYAMIGAARGFSVTLCVPDNVSPERKQILHAYGARIIWTPAGEGSDGALRKARELAAAHPDRYFYADQYSNPANWRAHYQGTAEEIWEQTAGRVTHFVAMMGTSGTFVGTARRLKELNPRIQRIALQPDSPFHGIEGAKHMASALVPAIYDPQLANRELAISTEAAHAMVRRMAREHGLLLGISAGAAIVGCVEVARSLPEFQQRGATIVTVFPDSGDKYLSEKFWEEQA